MIAIGVALTVYCLPVSIWFRLNKEHSFIDDRLSSHMSCSVFHSSILAGTQEPARVISTSSVSQVSIYMSTVPEPSYSQRIVEMHRSGIASFLLVEPALYMCDFW